MLILITWLVVYMLILLCLRAAAEPFKDRSWFKILFIPGTVIAALVQAGAAFLCISPHFKISLFEDRKPAFTFARGPLPWLSGSLFMLVTQLSFYIVYVLAFLLLESRGLIACRLLNLPRLYPQKIFAGRIDFDFGDYIGGLEALFLSVQANPLSALLAVYVMVGAFVSMRFSRRESFWTLLLVVIASAMTYTGLWFGLGFPFLSRGWWAEYFFFPDCWAFFSLFVTLAGLTLALFLLPGLPSIIMKVIRQFSPREEPPAQKTKTKRKATVTA